jgi:hypothetical protein
MYLPTDVREVHHSFAYLCDLSRIEKVMFGALGPMTFAKTVTSLGDYAASYALGTHSTCATTALPFYDFLALLAITQRRNKTYLTAATLPCDSSSPSS